MPDAVKNILRENGMKGLWKGWLPNVQRAALVNLGGFYSIFFSLLKTVIA